MFQKLPDLPVNIIMSGKAKTEEVSKYFDKFKNSIHRLGGWMEIKINARQMSNEENERNFMKFFNMLKDE